MNRLIVARSTLSGESPPVDHERDELAALGRIVVSSIVALAVTAACTPQYGAAGAPRAFDSNVEKEGAVHRAEAEARGSRSAFRGETSSPEAAAEDQEVPFCGRADAALARVAARVALRAARGAPPLDESGLVLALRAEGEPHIWPHAFTLSGGSLDEADVRTRVHAFLDSFAEGGERRCGVARAVSKNGEHSLAVVVVDALADLAPLPVRARVGQWLRLDATMLVPTTNAKLVVLGPTGAPRTVPTTLHGAHVEATFAPDREGPFLVQLVAVPSGGPRPVLEAMVFADTPPRELAEAPAPGERDVDASTDDAASIFGMVNRARASESLPPLGRSAELDRVANAHAALLEQMGRLAHDAGDGDPVERLHRAGLSPTRTGENIAHAASARLAHRLLWESPSHRGNMLDPAFGTLGVGSVRGPDGSVWICEIFASFSSTGINPE